MAGAFRGVSLKTAARGFDGAVARRLREIVGQYKAERVSAAAAHACLADIAQYLAQQFDLFAEASEDSDQDAAVHILQGINLLLEAISHADAYSEDDLYNTIDEGDEAVQLGRMLVASRAMTAVA